jgi:hypothetical protein
MTTPATQHDPDSLLVPCAAHPQVETALRCGKCEKPICPKCMVQTPVGARCRECANLKKLPMFVVTPLDYVKGLGTALATGILLGFIWSFIPFPGFFVFIIAIGAGYLLGEVMSRVLNRKRSRGLQAVAVLGVLTMVVTSQGWPAVVAAAPSVVGMLTAAGLALIAIAANPIAWLLVGLGALGAIARFRL